MATRSDSTDIKAIMREIQQSSAETHAMRHPSTGIPIPQPVITGMGNNMTDIPRQRTKRPAKKESHFFDYFRTYLKQGILFFFIFFLCSISSFKNGFIEMIPYFAQTGQISTFGQIVLALLATTIFILLQIIF